MKKIIVAILSICLALTLFACGDGTALDGRYNMSSMYMEGLELRYPIIAAAGLENSYISIDGQTAVGSIMGEEETKFEIDLSSNMLIDPLDSENNTAFEFSENFDVLTISAYDDTEMMEFKVDFVKEDSPLWDDILAEDDGSFDDLLGLGDLFGGSGFGFDYNFDTDLDSPDIDLDFDFDLPDTDSDLPEKSLEDYYAELEDSQNPDENGFISDTTSLELGTVWYGYMDIMNYEGPDDFSGTYDVYAVIDNDGYFDYFEIYLDASPDSYPITSYYIDLYDDYFIPIIDEYAYSFGEYLTEDDYFGYSAYLDNGFIFLSESFESEVESFEVAFGFREYGSLWDTDYDYLPPGYDSYIVEIGAV